MSKKVFISYSHQQSDWVRDRLVPCLRYGGAEVVIDYEHFQAGQSVIGQMDGHQDAAELAVLVLTPDYLASDYCVHEMERALQRNQPIVPIVRADCAVPAAINQLIRVDLRDDKDAAQWDKLLNGCAADLGASAPEWLRARDELRQLLQRGQSVNLVVTGNPKWRELIVHLQTAHLPDLGIVDFEGGYAESRADLAAKILEVCGAKTAVPEPPRDLVVLHRVLSGRTLSRVALLRMDYVREREHIIPLFTTLRNLMMDARVLVLLVESRRPLIELLPHDHPLSSIDIKTVELRGR